jgi:hypothetical protein
MDKVTKEQKSKLTTKFLELQRKGLVSYGKYLEKEFKTSEGKALKKAYHEYIVKELANNKIKIEKIDSKLS